MRAFKFFGLFLIVFSCIEPYQFVVKDNSPVLVVEGYISDKSYQATQGYPSDGRYFGIRLTQTSDVINVRPTRVSGAAIKLVSTLGQEWLYEASGVESGLYELYDPSFKAEQGVKYKIQIILADDVYESAWEDMPATEVPPMGTVGFVETESQKYVVEAGKQVLRTVQEVRAQISLPENASGDPIYYQWKFNPMWVFIAPLSPGKTRPGYMCWVTNPDYMTTYALQEDRTGGYEKSLFSIPTAGNERILDDFSVLVEQFAMRQNNYFFWKEMYDQNEGNVLVDKPPFNLQTNMHSLSGEKKVIGYFSVVAEQATRWYFNRSELSYSVSNDFKAGCEIDYGGPYLPGCPEPLPRFAACECKHCLDYSNGTATNVKPSWWKD